MESKVTVWYRTELTVSDGFTVQATCYFSYATGQARLSVSWLNNVWWPAEPNRTQHDERFRADSHYTSRFRSVAERHCSVKLSHVYLNDTDRNVSVKSQFRSVAERECLTGRNGSETVWTCSILIMWTVQRLVQYASSVCLQRVLPGVSSDMDEKLIELVRKCIKKYSDSVWIEKLWGQIGEELKKTGKFQLRMLKLLSFYYHRSSNN